jgi:hypothetical protein
MQRFEAEIGSIDTYDDRLEYGHAAIIAGPQPQRFRMNPEPPTYLPRGIAAPSIT